MNVQKFEKLKEWVNQYIDSFYCDDDFVNANIELKQAHTARVCDEMLYLTNSLSFGPHQEIIANQNLTSINFGFDISSAGYQRIRPLADTDCIAWL